MFEAVSNSSTLHNHEPVGLAASWLSMSNDNVDEDVDDDLDKILQQIKGGQAGMNDHTGILCCCPNGKTREITALSLL